MGKGDERRRKQNMSSPSPITDGRTVWVMTGTGILKAFDFKGKEYLVQSSKECRLWLLDTSALGGEDHRTPVYRTPLICNEDVNFAATGTWGALATWQEGNDDANGTRRILVPFWEPKHSQFTAPIEYGDVVRGAVAAFKMEDRAGKIVLTPAWLSRDMDQAEPPVVANGVVFAYGSGENTAQADTELGLGFNTAANRIAKSTHATLYALDARTGKELWRHAIAPTIYFKFGVQI